jgi:hypothetical protein
LDVISQGPKREPRLPARRWLAVPAAIGLIAGVIALALTGGGKHAGSRSAPPATPATTAPAPLAAPLPHPAAAPGTVLLGCDSATPGQLAPDWRTASLRAGPVWFVDGRQIGYVHENAWHSATAAGHGTLQFVVMIVEVTTGATAVIKPEAAATRHFHFVAGYSPAGSQLPAGDTGFTLAGCPPGSLGPNGAVTDFYLGFATEPGWAAPVDVSSPGMPRPIRLIFTCPARGCGTTG